MNPNVLTLINQLSNNEADQTEASQFYIDVMGDLAEIPILTNFADIIPNVDGTVTLPASAVRIIQVFYNGSMIGEIDRDSASWLFPNWENTNAPTLGTPQAYIRDSFSQRIFRLVPKPSNGALLCRVIYAETRDALPVWLQLPVALLILDKEYRRESDHHNDDIAAACKTLGTFLLSLLTG